ncbi:MAG: OsmC family peroxiredoxin [Hirschia sp.]|nr:OsmC family peroxiredoxin [Hirschia sp.]MBF17252.1 OsmC family peroxiredoxin [Hirschia sp.]|tara:strand:- start:292 stop:726 length:435 start_codon:yes stop_codon:yes gene_type:complete
MQKQGSARWAGDLKSGQGSISTESGALKDQPYGFGTRFNGQRGTNPEELIGAAHAACFSMALANMLSDEGMTPETIDTTADVTLDKDGDGFSITKVHLDTTVSIPDADHEAVTRIIAKAKENCPVSKLLSAEITLSQTLNPPQR